jgi:vitamin B12 transporter
MRIMTLRLLAIGILGFVCITIRAQSLDDTLHIDEVAVVGAKSKFTPGIKIETIGKKQLEVIETNQLSHVLSRVTPIYVKTTSTGLSTISLRGTKPDHTAIYYDGVNFNSKTLGHSNIANLPMFLFDEIEIQYGGASSIYGSDVIGGGIHLNSRPQWNKGLQFSLHQDIASFHSYFSGAKVRVGNGKFESSTKIFQSYAKNDFTFENPYKRWSSSNIDTQHHAAVRNNAVLQEFFYRENKHNYFLKGYYSNSWYQAQPNMSDNYFGGSRNELENKNSRVIAGYTYQTSSRQALVLRANFARDFQLYSGSTTVDTIGTNQIKGIAEYENEFNWNAHFKIGSQYSYITPFVEGYPENLKEHNSSYYLSYLQNVNTTDVAINIRFHKVSGFRATLSPSLGITQRIQLRDDLLVLSAFVSRNFKTPTFNDRFYPQLGNENLLAEISRNAEASIKYHSRTLKINTSAYLMDVDNWIQWNPGGDGQWRPENYQRVQSMGIEYSMEFLHKLQIFKIQYMLKGRVGKSLVKEVFNNRTSSVGNELPYSPRITGLGYINIIKDDWHFSIDAQYFGERYHVDELLLNDYFLLNFSTSYVFELGQSKIVLLGEIKNTLDASYINMSPYATPGINWRLGIKYNFKTK